MRLRNLTYLFLFAVITCRNIVVSASTNAGIITAQNEKIMIYAIFFTVVLLGITLTLLYNMNKKYKNLVEYDTLTGLKTMYALSKDYEDFSSIGIIYVRIENESHLNRIYGYDFFNKVLVKFASRLNNIARHNGARLYKVGGRSLCLVIPNKDVKVLDKIVEEIIPLNDIKTNFGEIELQLSLGVYNENFAFDTIKELLVFIQTTIKKVSNNKYQKDRIVHIDEESVSEFINHRYQITDIENAITNDQFVPVFQPQVRINDNCIIGMEVLARWNKNGEIKLPYYFIKVAEDANLIGEIEVIITTKAIKFLRQLIDNNLVCDDFVLSINLSPKTILYDNQNFGKIINLIKDSGIDPRYFKIEITEEGLKEIPQLIHDCIAELNSQNIKVALDDFSAGDSSLVMVSRFPFETIKIDRQLLLENNFDLKKLTLRFIKDYADILNRGIIVEGVENAEDVHLLQDLGINHVQGYFYSRPIPADEFIEFCKKKEFNR